MATAPNEVLRLKQGSTFAWHKQFVSLMADGTVTPVNLTDTVVLLRMRHLQSGSLVIAGASAQVTNATSGQATYLFSASNLATVGMHQCEWNVGGIWFPFESYDLVEVEENL